MSSPAEHPASLDRPVGRLLLVLALTTLFLVIEVAGSLLTGSLALLADAGHLLTDVTGLGLALLATWFARRPASPRNTFGYYRLEILAALLNGVLLLGVAVFILYEAWERLGQPAEIASTPMLLLALAGLGVNLIGVRLLHGAHEHGLHVQAACLEVVADALGSLAVVVAAVLIQVTGWALIDTLFSIGIGLFIVPRTVRLLSAAVQVLLEASPAHIDLDALERALARVQGVLRIHDLHVWTITSGFVAMSGHAVLDHPSDAVRVLASLRAVLERDFGITHSTIQLERLTGGDADPCPDETCVVVTADKVGARAD
jgi:cobalt-zinc-cadmium efflux system protein